MREVFVNMGQIHGMAGDGILTTVGLGSCVGVALYDSSAQVGVMGHIFLPQSRPHSAKVELPGKFRIQPYQP